MKKTLLFVCACLLACPAFAMFDRSGSGLSDIFEFVYFGGPADPYADPDGDGYTNFEEMIWGTGPTDPDSTVAGTTAAVIGEGLVLSWPAAAGKYYRIQATRDFEEWVTVIEGQIVSPQDLPLDPFGTDSALTFWRVQVFATTPDTSGNGFDDWEEALWQATYGSALSDSDIDGDGLTDLEEFLGGHEPGKKDHPAVGLVVFTPLEK